MPLSIDDILMRHLLGALGPGPGDRFLDLGTGSGFAARAFASRGAWVAGVDRSADSLTGPPGPWPKNACVCVADALDLPFGSRTFDAVTCRQSLHHIRELNRAFEELGRVLAPGGSAGIIDGIAPASEKVSAFLHRAYDLRDQGTHVRFMTLTRWRELFRAAGLHLVRVEARLVWHDLEVWARKAHASRDSLGELKAHFESAPAAARAGLRMVPAAGVPARFATVEAVMLGRR